MPTNYNQSKLEYSFLYGVRYDIFMIMEMIVMKSFCN